jgi:hypothetical protein
MTPPRALLPRPVPPRRPAVPIVRWRPVAPPPVPVDEQVAAWVSELARGELV